MFFNISNHKQLISNFYSEQWLCSKQAPPYFSIRNRSWGSFQHIICISFSFGEFFMDSQVYCIIQSIFATGSSWTWIPSCRCYFLICVGILPSLPLQLVYSVEEFNLSMMNMGQITPDTLGLGCLKSGWQSI